METTLATCDFCDTYYPVFLTLYISLLAVIVSDALDGKWRRKEKITPPQPGAQRPVTDSKAGCQRTENKSDADHAITQEEK